MPGSLIYRRRISGGDCGEEDVALAIMAACRGIPTEGARGPSARAESERGSGGREIQRVPWADCGRQLLRTADFGLESCPCGFHHSGGLGFVEDVPGSLSIYLYTGSSCHGLSRALRSTGTPALNASSRTGRDTHCGWGAPKTSETTQSSSSPKTDMYRNMFMPKPIDHIFKLRVCA